MNLQQIIAGATIAVLRRQFPTIAIKEQIVEALKIVKALRVEDDIARKSENKKEFRTGNKDITSAGTAEQLTNESIPIPEGNQVTVVAKPDNEGYVYFGNSKEECQSATKKFDGLAAGLAHSFRISNIDLIWVNVSKNGEGVSWYVEF